MEVGEKEHDFHPLSLQILQFEHTWPQTKNIFACLLVELHSFVTYWQLECVARSCFFHSTYINLLADDEHGPLLTGFPHLQIINMEWDSRKNQSLFVVPP